VEGEWKLRGTGTLCSSFYISSHGHRNGGIKESRTKSYS